jgi:DNA segregation ATPase FtsK/SpoIIIE, S-DNA-T family
MPGTRSKRSSRRRKKNTRAAMLPELPQLEQHHWDLIGLALVGFALFFACVFYMGWAGGEVGQAMADGFLYLFGGVGYLAPVVLFACGALLVLKPMLPTVRPFRSGAICLIAGLCLGLATGSLGPNRPSDHFLTSMHDLRHLGGLFGEGMYQLTSTLFSGFGAHLLFVFLLLAGLLLLTGASIGGIVKATHEGMNATTQRLKRSTAEFAAILPGATTRQVGHDQPPEVEPVVRATHVEAPAWDSYEDEEEEEEEPQHEPDRDPEEDEDGGAPEPDEAAPGEEQGPEQEPDPIAEPHPHEHDEPAAEESLTPQGNRRSAVTEADGLAYRPPNPGALKRSNGAQKVDTRGIERTGHQLVEALSHFNVEGKVIGTVTGPHVTRYELGLAPGIKMSKVSQLKDDLAYALAAEHVRILAPIPGKRAVGVEVPNRVRKMVHLGDVFQEAPPKWSPLTVWLGKDIAGKAIGTDLAKQPHVLVAGTTGSGKSGAINAMLSSILLRATPNEVRMVLVDPKRVELNHYEQIPHLLTPVITSPRLAANALANLIKEMEERYGVMSRAKTRNLEELNRVRRKQGEAPLPYILCVIDELADLMMVAPADVEDAIIRLAQKSRAVGIHLLLATQRPSADVITGMIKANVPARIAFAVSSQTDSRVILDQNGAESLLGQGDMLFRPAGESRSARIQGAFITEEEIEKLTAHWRRQGEPELNEELLEAVEPPEEEGKGDDDFDPDADELLGDAISTVVQLGSASTSMLQRRLRVGYTRAGRLIDMMERRGVISGYEGSKARQVLITEADLPRVLENLAEPVAAD